MRDVEALLDPNARRADRLRGLGVLFAGALAVQLPVPLLVLAAVGFSGTMPDWVGGLFAGLWLAALALAEGLKRRKGGQAGRELVRHALLDAAVLGFALTLGALLAKMGLGGWGGLLGLLGLGSYLVGFVRLGFRL